MNYTATFWRIGMQSREQKLESALKELRDAMQSYGDQHMAKSPPQYDKANANYALVHVANSALGSRNDIAKGV